MLKIKTKVLKNDNNNEFIGVSYKVKDSSNYEHLVVINHLIQEILKTKLYSKKELLDIIKIYIEKDN